MRAVYTVKVWHDGTKEWSLNGKRHREDGPAIEHSGGSKEWWLNDKLHREDSPAIEWADGAKEWWLNGKRHSKEEFRKELKLMSTTDKQIQILEEELMELKRIRQREAEQ